MGTSASCAGCCEPMTVKFIPPEKRTPRESRQVHQHYHSRLSVADEQRQQLQGASTVLAAEQPRDSGQAPSTHRLQQLEVDWRTDVASSETNTSTGGTTANPLGAPSEAGHAPPRLTTQWTTAIEGWEHQRARESRARRRNESAAMDVDRKGATTTLTVSWKLDEASEAAATTPRGALLQSHPARPLPKLVVEGGGVGGGSSSAGEPSSSRPTTNNTAGGDGPTDESRVQPLASQEFDFMERPTNGVTRENNGTVDDDQSSAIQSSALLASHRLTSPRVLQKETWNRDPFPPLSDDETD